MQKINVIPVLLVLTLAVIGGSCSRKEGVDTPFTRIVGKWKKVNYATDDNGNGAIDPYEIHEVENGVNNTIAFNADSTGYETNDFTPQLNFTWRVVEDSIYRTGSGHLSIVYHLAAVNSNNLTLTTNTNLGLAWYMYEKR
ncbi:MAG: lipocalin family protein [Bacteroidota bacterium]